MDKFKYIDSYMKSNISDIVKKLYGIQLPWYQKIFVDMVEKFSTVTSRLPYRCGYKKYETYLRLLNVWLDMDEDGEIRIVNPNGVRILTKDEFCDYLQNEYWNKKFDKNSGE